MDGLLEFISYALSQVSNYSSEDISRLFGSVSNLVLAIVAVVALIRLRTIKGTINDLRDVPDKLHVVTQSLSTINVTADRIREVVAEIEKLDTLTHKIDERMSSMAKQIAILQVEVASLEETGSEPSDNWSKIAEIRMRNVEGIESLIARSSISSEFTGMSRCSYTDVLDKMQRNQLLGPSHVNFLKEIFSIHHSHRNQRPRRVTDEDVRKAQALDRKLDAVFGRTSQPKVILRGKQLDELVPDEHITETPPPSN